MFAQKVVSYSSDTRTAIQRSLIGRTTFHLKQLSEEILRTSYVRVCQTGESSKHTIHRRRNVGPIVFTFFVVQFVGINRHGITNRRVLLPAECECNKNKKKFGL